jgi:hypothetical protein
MNKGLTVQFKGSKSFFGYRNIILLMAIFYHALRKLINTYVNITAHTEEGLFQY